MGELRRLLSQNARWFLIQEFRYCKILLLDYKHPYMILPLKVINGEILDFLFFLSISYTPILHLNESLLFDHS